MQSKNNRLPSFANRLKSDSIAQGMQHNPGVPTIESELMGALSKAGAISPANAGKFVKVWASLRLE